MNAKHTPWTMLAGTLVQDRTGKILFCACEESEQRGGDFDSIRDSLKVAVEAVNERTTPLRQREELRIHIKCLLD